MRRRKRKKILTRIGPDLTTTRKSVRIFGPFSGGLLKRPSLLHTNSDWSDSRAYGFVSSREQPSVEVCAKTRTYRGGCCKSLGLLKRLSLLHTNSDWSDSRAYGFVSSRGTTFSRSLSESSNLQGWLLQAPLKSPAGTSKREEVGFCK